MKDIIPGAPAHLRRQVIRELARTFGTVDTGKGSNAFLLPRTSEPPENGPSVERAGRRVRRDIVFEAIRQQSQKSD